MNNETIILGCVLALFYNILTTKKEDYKELGFWITSLIYIFILTCSWIGLISSIAADVLENRRKIKELENKSKEDK